MHHLSSVEKNTVNAAVQKSAWRGLGTNIGHSMNPVTYCSLFFGMYSCIHVA